MVKFLKGFLFSLILAQPCLAGTLTIPTSYATSGQVTSTNLNGNFTAIASVLNGGLDNDNVNTTTYRFPEIRSSLPTVGTVGKIVFLTSDNSLNFDNGAAWIKAVSIASPVRGDVIYYGASGWASLATGTSGQYLKANGAGADPSWATLPTDTTMHKIGTFTRDSSTASGTQAITGVGFQPVGVIFFMDEDGTAESSWGMDNGSTADGFFSQGASLYNRGGVSIYDYVSGGNNTFASISAFGADGFTLTWTKNGSPTGTLNIVYFAFK